MHRRFDLFLLFLIIYNLINKIQVKELIQNKCFKNLPKYIHKLYFQIFYYYNYFYIYINMVFLYQFMVFINLLHF